MLAKIKSWAWDQLVTWLVIGLGLIALAVMNAITSGFKVTFNGQDMVNTYLIIFTCAVAIFLLAGRFKWWVLSIGAVVLAVGIIQQAGLFHKLGSSLTASKSAITTVVNAPSQAVAHVAQYKQVISDIMEIAWWCILGLGVLLVLASIVFEINKHWNKICAVVIKVSTAFWQKRKFLYTKGCLTMVVILAASFFIPVIQNYTFEISLIFGAIAIVGLLAFYTTKAFWTIAGYFLMVEAGLFGIGGAFYFLWFWIIAGAATIIAVIMVIMLVDDIKWSSRDNNIPFLNTTSESVITAVLTTVGCMLVLFCLFLGWHHDFFGNPSWKEVTLLTMFTVYTFGLGLGRIAARSIINTNRLLATLQKRASEFVAKYPSAEVVVGGEKSATADVPVNLKKAFAAHSRRKAATPQTPTATEDALLLEQRKELLVGILATLRSALDDIYPDLKDQTLEDLKTSSPEHFKAISPLFGNNRLKTIENIEKAVSALFLRRK